LILLASLLLLVDIGIRTVSSQIWRLLVKEISSTLKVSVHFLLSLKAGSLENYVRLIKDGKRAQRQQQASEVFKSRTGADESYLKLLSLLAQRRREKDQP